MHICIFEDRELENLQPLVHFKPVYDLMCGMTTLRQKIVRLFSNASVTLHVRSYLAGVLRRDCGDCLVNEIPSHAGEVLFINGRVLADPSFPDRVKYDGTDSVYSRDGVAVAAWLSGKNLENVGDLLQSRVLSLSDFSGLEERNLEVPLVTYPWELVNYNGEQIAVDFALVTHGSPQVEGNVSEGVHLLNPARIHISEGAAILPGAVLDAQNGPIYIGRNSKVLPNAVIEGPVFIGENTLIKVGAKIYENTSVGRVCKVGGEVEETIIDSYSNKQHDGFIGHAYLGSWVNIGAGTNNSDLKNNYGPVKVYVRGQLTDTGSMFVGLFMGDHSKSGINQMFNTGTVVGVCCNVFGPGQPPKFVPSFSWGSGDGKFVTYRIDKAVEVAEKVMARRDVQFTDADKNLFQTVFNLTARERQDAHVTD